METIPSSSSSSSSSPRAKRFDVFLSFRGDTRYNFTSHLSSALRRIGLFNIFKDDYKLQRGKNIEEQLMNAIEDSHYAVVVLSEEYAESDWCLKELAKIIECMENSGRIRTIFYKVNLSKVKDVVSLDVQKQNQSRFWGALNKHAMDHARDPSRYEYQESWRTALFKVTREYADHVFANTDEDKFIKAFVADMSSKLGASIRTTEGLFGMDSRLLALDSYVLEHSTANNVCFIGIHGMGGIGKTTLAEAYYMKMSHKFEGSSFLANIKSYCKNQVNGLVHLQKQLLKDILEADCRVDNPRDGINFIRSRLLTIKVLIVLDDVDELEHLNALAGSHKKKQGSKNELDIWFAPGSVIIMTTRNRNLLTERYTPYGAQLLDDKEALQLFYWEAFKSIEPPEQFKEQSKQVVKYASNLPLALTVLGSHFDIEKTIVWEDELHRLKMHMEKKIFEKLKVSFDDLNNVDQRIFLDIACFFGGLDKDYVISILNNCGFKPINGINNLINKSLLSTQHDRKLWIHYLLQEMGKEIVRADSSNELSKQSRIWDADDLYHILENHNKGKRKVEAIVTNLKGSSMEFKFEALSYMQKLRLLIIKYLSNEFPSSFLPREQLWNGIKLYHLKVIDLSFSLSFTKLENFTMVPNLETLILQHCEKLSEIHPSIRQLKKLILLNLDGCTSLEELPEAIIGLASLQTLKLSGCRKLKKLPDNLEQLKSLRDLELNDIEGSGIKHLPSSIFLMENLESVSCDEEMIKSVIRKNIISYRTTGKCFFPRKFCISLAMLDLTDCNLSGPEAFPEYFGKLVSLRYLYLSKNPFSVLPPGINGLSRLTTLRLDHCKSLRCLEPQLLPSSLQVVHVNYCTSLASFLDPSKPCHLRCSSVFCLDCTELVDRQDAKMTALASLSRFLDQDPHERRDQDFKFVVPHSDNELPSWFINKSSTAPITIKLDSNWCNSELMGFAMVFCFRANSSTKEKLSCNIRLRGSENWETTMEVGVIESRNSDHLFLLYSRCEDVLEYVRQLEPPSCDTLEFSFRRANEEQCSSCGPCGVRLVYEEDIQELKKLTSISQLSKLKHMGPFGPALSAGLRLILDLEDNLEFVEMQGYADEDPPNPESNHSIVGNTRSRIIHKYSGITTKFLEK